MLGGRAGGRLVDSRSMKQVEGKSSRSPRVIGELLGDLLRPHLLCDIISRRIVVNVGRRMCLVENGIKAWREY
jgi:hypothetical protein